MADKYRKKPVGIEAVRFEYSVEGINKLKDFCGESFKTWWKAREMGAVGYATILTLEGEHTATEGDYIIKGVKGEFYPCKPDIFELTYEKERTNND